MSIVTDGLWTALDRYLARREREAGPDGDTPLAKSTVAADRQRISQLIRYLETREG